MAPHWRTDRHGRGVALLAPESTQRLAPVLHSWQFASIIEPKVYSPLVQRRRRRSSKARHGGLAALVGAASMQLERTMKQPRPSSPGSMHSILLLPPHTVCSYQSYVLVYVALCRKNRALLENIALSTLIFFMQYIMVLSQEYNYFGMNEHRAKTKNRLSLPNPAARGGPNGKISGIF